MPDITLAAETGRPTGSAASGRLRATGKIPAVLYGHGIAPITLAIDARALRTALTSEAGVNALLNLKVGGDEHLAIARQLQRDPVRHSVIHVDFQVVSRDEVLRAEVPVVLVGEAVALHREGGIVSQEQFVLVIHATPDRIPTNVEVDITDLEIGASIRVGDVRLPEGVTADIDPEVPLVTGQAPTVVEEPEAEAAVDEEGEEGEEGAEPGAEGTEGARDSGGGASEGEGDD
jgi:large subunit ribosomal protein L25